MNKKNNNKVFIIAEAGVNHNGSLEKAFKLVDIAKNSGADAVKFQLFNAEEQVSDIAKNANYQFKGSKEKNMKKMTEQYYLPWEAHIRIKKYADKNKIKYFSSCCDINSVDFLVNKLRCKIIKISSGEITNLNLIRHISKKNLNVIISSGMATFEEIDLAISILKKNSKNNIILLHCVSIYPGKDIDQNLNLIKILRKKYKLKIGYSDHTRGNISSIIATSLGAEVLEKHFTINKGLKGPDHSMSLNPSELKNYVQEIRKTEKIIGNLKKKNISHKETLIKKIARRGVISTKRIKNNEKLTIRNIYIKRPLIGIDAKYFDNVLNKKINKDIPENTPIKWEMLKKK
ncbi:N-acetylneuraminate synthase family protein [Candidatus Pelagibacter ubique]|nr:N-acetylneuraminate synthase family protein [Candidatus Pelagibacter ubique]